MGPLVDEFSYYTLHRNKGLMWRAKYVLQVGNVMPAFRGMVCGSNGHRQLQLSVAGKSFR